MLPYLLKICFYLLFALTPWVFLPFNHELFEYNKMVLVYILTIISLSLWALLMVEEKKVLLKKTPFDIPILVFLGANMVSTLFSIDPHISFWGYYSRSNGGLLSTICYISLYYCLVSNFNKDEVVGFLKAVVLSAAGISIWGVMEHFGASLSCYFLSGKFNNACWVQDVQARVFATLGQPNWFAAFLEMIFFIALYFALTAKNQITYILYTASLILIYLAFTFTYSRGATLGLVASFATLVFFIITQKKDVILSKKSLLFISAVLVLINLIFGSALTTFKLLDKSSSPNRESITSSITTQSGTQLENGGTESGAIRLIVWRGAIEIFKHNPIFGSGVETFAYSYFQHRPTEHNLVSEWDFLYNKAHNEYLNYLSTTGAVGFSSYLFLIGSYLFWATKKTLRKKVGITHFLLASYIAYLIQNFFGFSVVTTALLFFLIPAISLVLSEEKLDFVNLKFKVPGVLGIPFIIFIGLFLVFTTFKFWMADTFFAVGTNYLESGNPGKAYSSLVKASTLNNLEPFYKSELAITSATIAAALGEEEATLSSQMKELSESLTDKVLREHPKNTSFYKTAVRTYYLLSTLDPKFLEKTLDTVDKAIALSPTDPKLLYSKALVLQSDQRYDEAIEALKKAVSLKPNYREGYLSLSDVYIKKEENEKAKEVLDTLLKLIPNDPEALEKLKKL